MVKNQHLYFVPEQGAYVLCGYPSNLSQESIFCPFPRVETQCAQPEIATLPALCCHLMVTSGCNKLKVVFPFGLLSPNSFSLDYIERLF